jgi:hypothetical protein
MHLGICIRLKITCTWWLTWTQDGEWEISRNWCRSLVSMWSFGAWGNQIAWISCMWLVLYKVLMRSAPIVGRLACLNIQGICCDACWWGQQLHFCVWDNIENLWLLNIYWYISGKVVIVSPIPERNVSIGWFDLLSSSCFIIIYFFTDVDGESSVWDNLIFYLRTGGDLNAGVLLLGDPELAPVSPDGSVDFCSLLFSTSATPSSHSNYLSPQIGSLLKHWSLCLVL